MSLALTAEDVTFHSKRMAEVIVKQQEMIKTLNDVAKSMMKTIKQLSPSR